MDSNIHCSAANPKSDGVDEVSVENVVSSTDDNQVNDTHNDDCVSDHVSSSDDCASDECDLPLPPTPVDEDNESADVSSLDAVDSSDLSTIINSDENLSTVIDSDENLSTVIDSDECVDWGE